MINVYPHQLDIANQVRQAMASGVRRTLVQSATGSGKTVINTYITQLALAKGNICWFTVHRKELVEQSINTFRKFGINPGVVAPGYRPDFRNPVQVCSIDSLRSRAHLMIPPTLISVDECHHAVSRTWSGILDRFPKSYHIGWTATPERLDGRGLGECYDILIRGPETRWLIDNGYLCDYDYYLPETVDLSELPVRMGDYSASAGAEAMNKPTITGCAIDHYKRLAMGKRGIAFCWNIKHSMDVAQHFRDAGIPAEHMDGGMSRDDRTACMKRFRAGQTLMLTNANLIGEGLDVPSVEVVMLLKLTQSLVNYRQWIGRGLRVFPGKDRALVFDHCNNIGIHGYPDSEVDWTLEGVKRKKSKQETTVLVKQCPKCYADNANRSARCLYCGTDFVSKAKEVKQVDGELKKLERMNAQVINRKKRIERQSARSFEELLAVERKNGYKRGWAKYVYESRLRKG